MRTIQKIILGFTLVLAINSCKKDSGNDINPENINNPAVIKDSVIELSTDYGKMYIWLYKQTPLHRNNFFKLTTDSFFNGTTFHRLVTDFVIQGGDPYSKDSDSANDGTGGPGYVINAEIKDSLRHIRGAIGAARLPDNVNPEKKSSGSQFYISMTTEKTAQLNGKYTVFGFVMKGMDVADKIMVQPKNPTTNRPYQNIAMQVKILLKSLEEIRNEYGYTPPAW